MTAASLQWLIPSSSLQGPEGFRPLKLRPLAWIALIQGCSGNLQKVFLWEKCKTPLVLCGQMDSSVWQGCVGAKCSHGLRSVPGNP